MITGCGKKEDPAILEDLIVKDAEIIDEPNEEIPVPTDIDIQLLQRENGLYTYSIAIVGDQTITTGMPYIVEKSIEDDKWEIVELDLMFTMQLIIVDSDNPFTQDIDVSMLEPGIYRIYKNLMDENGEPLDDIYLEFEIFEASK